MITSRKLPALCVTSLLLLVGCGDTDTTDADVTAAETPVAESTSLAASPSEPPATTAPATTAPATTAPATTAPASTAPATNASGEGSREAPLAIGEAGTVEDWEVTLASFEADATETVMGMNQFNEEPESGTYALATFEIAYVGEEEGNPGFDLSYVVVHDGQQYSDTDCMATVDGGTMEAPTLENGGSTTVAVCYDVAVADGDVLFVEPLISFDDDARIFWGL